MSDLLPLYLVGPPGLPRERLAGALGPSVQTRDSVQALLEPELPEPGVVLLLGEGVPSGDVLRAARVLSRRDGEWTICLVQQEDHGAEIRTLSLGWKEDLEGVEAYRRGEQDRLLELRRLVSRMARTRHDINNPLTSGLAETQLLLMDVEDPELREALELIQRQLRRIRDLVQETQGIRPR